MSKPHRKITFYSEIAYFVALYLLALGTSLSAKAGLGLSMIVAPAYIIYRRVSEIFPKFTFGMAEYMFQGVLLIILILVVKRFRKSYLFSFVTALLYGFMLDFNTLWVNYLPTGGYIARLGYFFAGMLLCATGVSFVFHTYISPEVYELFVKEVSAKFGIKIERVKIIYDCSSCVLAIILSFLFFGFGEFVGIRTGTLLCAALNGFLIGGISTLLEKVFVFKDAFPLRRWFEGNEPK